MLPRQGGEISRGPSRGAQQALWRRQLGRGLVQNGDPHPAHRGGHRGRHGGPGGHLGEGRGIEPPRGLLRGHGEVEPREVGAGHLLRREKWLVHGRGAARLVH